MQVQDLNLDPNIYLKKKKDQVWWSATLNLSVHRGELGQETPWCSLAR